MRRRENPDTADKVLDELLHSQSKLRAAIQAGTEAAVVQAKTEEERKQVLVELRGDIQAIAIGIGEVVGRLNTVDERIASLEEFTRGFSLYVGGELREEMHKTRTALLEISELLALALRGWTETAMLSEAQGVDVPTPPGYEL